MSLSLFRCTQASDSSFFVSLETLPATCFSGVDDYVMMFCKDAGHCLILLVSMFLCDCFATGKCLMLYVSIRLFYDMKMFLILTCFPET